MCKQHDPAPVFRRPAPAAGVEWMIAYAFRGHATKIFCRLCGRTGRVRGLGKGIKWHAGGCVGNLPEERERLLAAGRRWDADLTAAEAAGRAG